MRYTNVYFTESVVENITQIYYTKCSSYGLKRCTIQIKIMCIKIMTIMLCSNKIIKQCDHIHPIYLSQG